VEDGYEVLPRARHEEAEVAALADSFREAEEEAVRILEAESFGLRIGLEEEFQPMFVTKEAGVKLDLDLAAAAAVMEAHRCSGEVSL